MNSLGMRPSRPRALALACALSLAGPPGAGAGKPAHWGLRPTPPDDFGRFEDRLLDVEARSWTPEHLSPVVEREFVWVATGQCPEDCIAEASWTCSFNPEHLSIAPMAWPSGCRDCAGIPAQVVGFNATDRLVRSRQLAEVARAAAVSGLVCSDVMLDLSACVDATKSIAREGFKHHERLWPELLAKELSFWATRLATSATSVTVKDPLGLLDPRFVVFGSATRTRRFGRRYLQAVKRVDLPTLQRSTLEWATNFEVALAPELPHGAVARRSPADHKFYLEMMLRYAGHEDHPAPKGFNATLAAAKDTRHILAQEAAAVAAVIRGRYLGQLIQNKVGVVIGRDASARFFAESCPILFECRCAFIDASSLRPSDTSGEYDTPIASLSFTRPSFVILLSLGSAGAPWTTGLNSHPYGDFLLLHLMNMLLDEEMWVIMATLGHEIDQVVVDVNARGEQRLAHLSGFVDCALAGCADSMHGRERCAMDPRSLLGKAGYEQGPITWVHGGLQGGYLSRRNEVAYAHWGCGGCAGLAGASRIRPVIVLMRRHRVGLTYTRITETTTPILAHTPSLLLSYPGSGQTLFRLLIEVLSGRPTLSLYELAMQWQRIPMSVCFEGAGDLRDVAHSGPPVLMVHHNSLYNRYVDKGSLQNMIVLVRDYKTHIGKLVKGMVEDRVGPPDEKNISEAVRAWAWEYMFILIDYDDFKGAKGIVLFEDLTADPIRAIKVASKVMGVQIRDSSFEYWREQGTQLQRRMAQRCADMPGEPAKGCGAPCRNFMKAHKLGPYHPQKPVVQKWQEGMQYQDRVLSQADAAWVTEASALGLRIFEQLMCPGALELSDSDPLAGPRLAQKYLRNPGWGSARPGQRLQMACWRGQAEPAA